MKPWAPTKLWDPYQLPISVGAHLLTVTDDLAAGQMSVPPFQFNFSPICLQQTILLKKYEKQFNFMKTVETCASYKSEETATAQLPSSRFYDKGGL